MSDTVEKIKERLSILDVVSPYVKLARAGKNYKGLSPFTKEKTPSFFVSVERGLYHCFSTGKGGDMFTFVEEMEGIDFKGALKILAEKAGVPLTVQKPGERDMKERLYAALSAASEFFVRTLGTRPDVKAYVLSRAVSDETIKDWSLGYAPNEWQALHAELARLGFTDSELERAGLVKQTDSSESQVQSQESKTMNSKLGTRDSRASRVYDRFRGRIMFPLSDVSGRVLGFSGRIFEDDPEHSQAKYINSPETDVFDKSCALYGIDRAREGIRELGAAILVEGQFDLIMAHQAGYRNTVATSGTALTERHVELLKRYSQNLLIAYDGDRAGIAAAGRAAAVALRAGMNVKVAKLPPGADPADLIKDNIELFKEAVKGALHVVDFYLAHITDAKYDARTFRLEVSRVVLPYVAMIDNKIDQAHFVKRVAEVLQVPEEAVAAEAKKVHSLEFKVQSSNSELGTKDSELARSAEPFLSRGETIERLLFGLMLLFTEHGDTESARKTEAVLRAALSEAEFSAFSESDAKRTALFEADLFLERYAEPKELSQVMEELFETLKRESAHEHYRETLVSLRAAEVARDEAQTAKLMQELSALASALR